MLARSKTTARRGTFRRSHRSCRRRRNLVLEARDTRTPKPHHSPVLQKHKRYYLHHRIRSQSSVPTKTSVCSEMVACLFALTVNLHVRYHQTRAGKKISIPQEKITLTKDAGLLL
jgi:hypothetical protein